MNTPMKNKATKKKRNRELLVVTYAFVFMVVGMIAYIIRFELVDSKQVINNSYNKRANLLEETIQRGMILGSGGEILAKSEEDSAGNMVRVYPYGSLFSHTVGRYEKSKTGLENSMSFTLLTSSINGLEKAWNGLNGQKSKGDNIKTTLDVNLTEVVNDALGNYKGAVVVMEPSTGRILSMVSKPDYNPNTVSKDWDKIISLEDKDSVLINRATQSTYPPGSIFKIITTLAYIRDHADYESFSYDCHGRFQTDRKDVECYKGKRHGKLDLNSAFAKSCNGAFAKMLSETSYDTFMSTAKQLLFNTSFDKLSIPVKGSKVTYNKTDDLWMTAQTAIGQGETTTNPMHMAMIVSAIANDGKLMNPYMVDEVLNADQETIKTFLPSTYTTLMTSKEAEILSGLMESVVTSGTATSLKNKKYTVAGKTGTAEKSGEEPYVWFVGYSSTDEKADIAVSVCIEEGGSSTEVAVPIAKKIFKEYYQHK